jgi:hypothetical protein
MAITRMRLQAEVSDPPYIEDDCIKVGVTVKDEDTGRAWSMKTELSQGNGPVFADRALPFDVLKQAENTLYDYLAQREVTAQLRVLRDQVIPHALGAAYRPMVGERRTADKVEYFLKS